MCRIAYAVKGWECVSDNENVKNVDDDHQTQVVECVCVCGRMLCRQHTEPDKIIYENVLFC